MLSSPLLKRLSLLGAGFILVISIPLTALALKGYFRYEVSQNTSHFVLQGNKDSQQFGAALARGDFNGDGFQDLIVTSPTYSSSHKSFRGKVSLFFGGETFFRSSSLTFLGARESDQLGVSVTSGDFNGDGIDDLIMGTLQSGKIYMMFGEKRYYSQREFDLSHDRIDFVVQGPENEKFGFALDMADWNQDGRKDLIIGSPGASEKNKDGAGKVYIVYGSDIHNTLARNLLKNPADVLFTGRQKNDQFGATLVHGDFNDDHFSDLAIGSYLDEYSGQEQGGTVFVFYGSDKPKNKPEDVLSGDSAFAWFGYGLAALDVNGDSIHDLAVTSFPFSSSKISGKASIFLGSRKKGSMKDREIAFADDELGYVLGSSVALGDANNDGFNDLIVGSAGLRQPEENFPGKVSVLTHFSRQPGNVSLPAQVEDLRIGGNSLYDWFGSSILFEDFNGDYVKDLIVGAPSDFFDGNGRPGAVYVFPGPLIPRGEVFYSVPNPDEVVTRGSLVDQVIRGFSLKNRNKELLAHCYKLPEPCLFDFTGQSRFNGIQLQSPLILYPDVHVNDPFYDSVHVATILGLVRGFSHEKESPFHPEQPVSRIHGLKVLLQAISALEWKESAELKKELGGAQGIRNQKTLFNDVSGRIPHMWWYPRYVNFAYLAHLIEDQEFFAPDEPLTQRVLQQWITNAKKIYGL